MDDKIGICRQLGTWTGSGPGGVAEVVKCYLISKTVELVTMFE